MDFETAKLLLAVVYDSLGVPNTDNIRNAALAELAAMNSPKVEPVAIPSEPEESGEGDFGDPNVRRL